MNIQEYISSGIIESYVLGLASAEERVEVESMCRQYPEILEARIAFESAIEKQAMENAVDQPGELKEKIITTALASSKVVSLSNAPVKKANWLKYAAAASVLLLAGSLYWNITLYNQNKQLQNSYENTVAKLNDMEEQVRMISLNPHVKMAAMKGMDASPNSYATVYWDTTSKDVYLLVNNLPAPPTDKQYQLWALLNGKPIDMGMIENEFFIDEKKLLLKMKNASEAQAFAITLEKKGGNPTPEGDMYVMGNL